MPASIEGFNDEAIKKQYKESLYVWLKRYFELLKYIR